MSVLEELRRRTQAGYMECKKALAEALDDIEKAVVILKKRGAARMDNKMDVQTDEGAVFFYRDDNGAYMVELSSETDFAAKSDKLSEFASMELKSFASSVESDLDQLIVNGENFQERLGAVVLSCGEKIALQNSCKMPCDKGSTIFVYAHNIINDVYKNAAKNVVILRLAGDVDDDFAKKVGMHIVACKPESVQEACAAPFLLDSNVKLGDACKNKGTALVEFKLFYTK